jgi:hypothetical protein
VGASLRTDNDGVSASVAEDVPGGGDFLFAARMDAQQEMALAQTLSQDVRAHEIHASVNEEVGDFPAILVSNAG